MKSSMKTQKQKWSIKSQRILIILQEMEMYPRIILLVSKPSAIPQFIMILHWKLKSPIVMHSNEGPHQCSKCMALFRNVPGLRRPVHRKHVKLKSSCKSCRARMPCKTMSTKHNMNAIRKLKFPCQNCGKSLTKVSETNQHVKTIHRGDVGDYTHVKRIHFMT